MPRILPVLFLLALFARPALADTVRFDKALAPYDRIEVSAPFDFVWHAGAPQLSVEGEVELAERLRYEVVGGTLKLSVREGSFRLPLLRKLKVTLSSANVREARLLGSGELALQSVSGPVLVLSLSGSGDLLAQGVKVHRLDVRLSGSGDLTADGDAEVLTAALSGSGDVVLKALDSRDATVSLAGSGDLSARVTHRVVARCTGSGDIVIEGAPVQRDVDTLGTCEIRFGR